MSLLYYAFHKVLRNGATEDTIPEPVHIMSGSCSGEYEIGLQTVPCFCPRGQYVVTESRPSLSELTCVCGHSFATHDSSLDSTPRHGKLNPSASF